jgi:FAD dependent oxidoreductase TIGR03364
VNRLVVVGGGVIGTMHALQGVERGWSVVHLEREDGPRGASVRNFGLIWVSGRAGGPELTLALEARALWESIAARYPGTGFRANGSLTVASTPEEEAVLEEVAARDDAATRAIRMLSPDETHELNPALGKVRSALHCAKDAVVEPRTVLGALREACLASDRYRWLPGREVMAASDHEVVDAAGERHQGDLVVLCTGASHRGLVGQAVPGAPLRRVRLQMMETARYRPTVTTSLADGDSLRYYPAFDVPARAALQPQSTAAAAWTAQLLIVQRLDGGLTIGDSHTYDEPFSFDVDEAPYEHFAAAAAAVLVDPPPPVVRRWAGVYSQVTDPSLVYLRQDVAPGVQLVTGLGGRGMSLSPAVATETFR